MTEHLDRPSIGKVYDAINDVRIDVAVIKESLPDIADHESRLRSLEKRVWSFAGLATLAGATLSAVIDRLLINQ